jgi:hypothetical protein
VRPGIPPSDRVLNSEPEKLRGSKFDTRENLAAFAQAFDEGVKRIFSNDQVVQYVKFGSMWDTDPKYGIRGGKLKLAG